MTTALATRPQNQQLEQAAEQVRTLASYLRAREGKLAEIVPKMVARLLTPQRLIAIVASAASRTPKLLQCTPESVYTELHKAAQLGLEAAGPMGHYYLVPRWNSRANRMECTGIIGYKGLAELCRRSGEIARIDAAVVYDGELFEVRRGLSPDLVHVWDLGVQRTDSHVVAAYAVLETNAGAKYFEVLSRSEIERRRDRSQAKADGPWGTDFAAMCRKTALRALLAGGLVPLSSELATALELDGAAELPDAADLPVDLPVDVPPAEPTPEPPAAAEPPRTQQAAAEIKRRGRPRKTEQQQQPEARAPSSAPSPEDEDAFAVPDDAPPDAPPAAADAAPSTPALALHAKALNLVEDGRATGWLSPQNAAQWNGWLAAHKNSAESMQNAVIKLTEQLAKAAAAPQDQPA